MSPATFLRPRALLGLIAGYLIWASCFVSLYTVLSLGCALAPNLPAGPFGLNVITLVLALVWLLHLAGFALLIQRTHSGHPEDEHAGFMRRVSLILHFSALAATLWVGLPVLFLPPCA
ncbi:hypothetical protein [Aquibaculum sediminis]|uniref:hypothetical protein n=1 Tax=Aquibaculum sediminis TaxID=3231907 RepID=UPI003456D622